MIRRARYNVHSPMYERMTARLAQLYQATSPRPEVRAFSFSDVFESKQRLMLLEVQRRRKRAEMIRKLKRRHLLNGNLSTPAANGCGLLSSVVVGPAGRGGVRTRMLINTLRVPIRHEWKLY